MSSNRIYVGRLPYRCQERDIERFFKGFGKIRDIMLKNGYCFVEFDDYRAADDAVYERNGQTLCGERVVIEHARGTPHGEDLRRDLEKGLEYPPKKRGDSKSRSRSDYRLIVENLSTRMSWQELKDFMRQAGEVTYADAHRERRNEGIVEFATRREMERALDRLDGTEMNGRRIRLIEVKPRGNRRSRSQSRRRGASSRSRSRSEVRRSISADRRDRKSKSPDQEVEPKSPNRFEELRRSRSSSGSQKLMNGNNDSRDD